MKFVHLPLHIFFLLIFFNAFLANTSLADGLFSAKELGLYATVVYCGIAGSIYLLANKRVTLDLNIIDLLVISFLLILPLGQYFIFEETESSFLVQQISYLVIYLSLRLLFDNLRLPILASAVAESLGLIVFFHLVLAIAQYTDFLPVHYRGAKVTGLFFNPGPFGIYSSVLSVLLYTFFVVNLMAKRYLYSIIQGVAFIVAAWIVIITDSRSAWVGGVIGLFLVSVWLALKLGYFGKIRKVGWFKWACAIILVIGLFGAWKAYLFKKDSADGRLLIWSSTLSMIGDHCYTGVGGGNFAPQYLNYQSSYFKKNGLQNRFEKLAGDTRYAFNDVLQIAAEFGIIGLIIFLAIVFLILNQLFGTTIITSNAVLILGGSGIAIISSIIIAGLSAYPLQMTPIAMVFWCGAAISSGIFRFIKPFTKIIPLQRILLLVLLLSVSSYYSVYGIKRGIAYHRWGSAEMMESGKKQVLLRAIYEDLKENGEFLAELAKTYIDKKQYPAAMSYLREAISHSPSPAIYYTLGECYMLHGNFEEAKETINQVKFGIPNLMRPRYLLAKISFHQGNIPEFRVLANQALNFKPKIDNVEVKSMKEELMQLLSGVD
ncbi:O-antigen ligase family protein [Parapedobacter sp. 10938]|uniref:O-antigen ligase family protein n=1 Tax=Parapedobacter flavus TaxID=3110225 RepID=UPI002DB9F5D3|nr:O-antigen ligase family protein [Parapedobacter sp. 10938]MEC3881795.1 O-antigen ligase family protein [Parapedobacter sp. 10938]